MASEIAKLDTTKSGLATITDVAKIKLYISAMSAVQQVREAAGAELSEINEHVEKRGRLIRRGGELLKDMADRGERVRSRKQELQDVTLADLSVTKIESHRWQAIAKVPEGDFEAYWAERREGQDKLFIADLYRFARKYLRPRLRTREKGDTCTVEDLHKLVEAGRTFGTFYADPPWAYGNQSTRAATDNHYETVSVDWLCDPDNMPIEALADDKAHLHLWTTNAFLFDAKRIIEAWGFEYKSCFVWVKPSMGIGNYWRVSHEFLLLGVRGGLTFDNHSEMSWGEFRRGKHSRKPTAIRKKVEAVSPGPRLELFGREAASGWTVWGNEVSRELQLSLEIPNAV